MPVARSELSSISLILGKTQHGVAVCGQRGLKSKPIQVSTCVRPTSLVATGSTLAFLTSFQMFLSTVSNAESGAKQKGEISRNVWSQHCTSQTHTFSRSCRWMCVSKARDQARKEEGLGDRRHCPRWGWAAGVPDRALDAQMRSAGRDPGDDVPVLLCESWTMSWHLQGGPHWPALESWWWAAVCVEAGSAEGSCCGPASEALLSIPREAGSGHHPDTGGPCVSQSLHQPGSPMPSPALLLLVCKLYTGETFHTTTQVKKKSQGPLGSVG